MKKLLGVIGILALAAVLLPAQGHADLRGSFAPITNTSGFVNGCEQAAHRPIDADGIMALAIDGGRIVEEWYSFSTRSLIPGHESVRSIYLHINFQQAAANFGAGSAFAPLLSDPGANISYFDPAWSYDGRFLAYIQTNADGSGQTLYVQEYTVNDGLDFDYGPGLGAETAIGAPIMVSNSGNPRHPDWHPSQYTLAFDDNIAGSQDIYTADVDVIGGTASAATRRTFVNGKAETSPAWSPNGHDIAYSTNKFGPSILEIVDLNLVSTAPGYIRLAELNFASVSHGDPSYTSDGGTIYYSAPGGEDANAAGNVWSLNLTSQAKCEIRLDAYADSDPDVSGVLNHTQPGDGFQPFNYFLFTSQASAFGLNTWRANPINSCLLPLEMGIATVPSIMDINDATTTTFMTVMNFPPETRSAGYQCKSANASGLDGVRLRQSILASPTLLGTISTAGGGVQGTGCFDSTAHGLPDSSRIRCNWDFRTIADRIVALGLVGKIVPMKMTAYSNQAGRSFQGFSYLKLTASSLPAAGVALLGNSPNPFNPVTKIRFAVSKPGNYTLRLYNVQGALIKTVANQHYEVGTHEATWDGRTTNGGKAASGVYYAKIQGASREGSSGIKLVLAK